MAQENPIYNFLRENNLTQKSEADFLAEYSTPEKVETLYGFMTENSLTTKDYDSFTKQYFPTALGGAQEVSAQGSAGTSQTLEQPSSSSTEPSSGERRQAEFPDVVALVDVPEGQERAGVLSDAYYSLASGSSLAGQMIAGIPQYLYELGSVPFNLLADAVANNAGEEAAAFLRMDYENVKDLPPLQAASKVAKYYGDLSEENRAQVTQFEQGILENITEGNFSDAGRQVVTSIAESVPSMMTMLATSGAGQAAQLGTIGRHALSALPFASGSLQELEGNENIPDAYKPVIAGLHGFSEIVFEQSFGTTALVEEIINNRIGREGVKQFVEGYLQKALSSQGIPMALVRGGASEAATELSNNIIDKYSGVDPDRDLMQGVADAAIVGSVMDGGIRGASNLSNAVVGTNRVQAAQLEQEINQEKEDLNNPEVSEQAKDIIQENLEAKTDQLDGMIEESRSELSQLTPEAQQEVGSLLDRLSDIQEAVQDPNVSETTKTGLQEQAELISTEIDNLIAQTPETPAEVGAQETVAAEVVEETQAQPGQYFTREIGGEETVYRRNDDGTTSIVPQEEANAILSQPTETLVQVSDQVESVTEDVQETEVFTEPEQQELVNTALQEDGQQEEVSAQTIQELSTPTFFQTLTNGEQRASRIQSLEQSLRDSIADSQNLGISPNNRDRARRELQFTRDLTEYAVLKIADGTIKTANAFKDLVGGLGDFSDTFLSKVYHNATEVAKSYTDTSPTQENIDAATGEVLTRLQDVAIDRTPAKTRVKTADVKRLTSGGVQGKVTLTNRQALKTQIQTLNRGIREGRKKIAESRKEVGDFIKEMREQGLFRGKVRGSTINTLLNRVNKANTPSQLRNALDYAEKASSILEYDQKLSNARAQQARAKRLSRRKTLPADVADVLKGMGQVNTSYITDIDAFNQQLRELIGSVEGTAIEGIGSDQHRQLMASVKRKIEQARIQNLKGQLLDAGMTEEFVEGLNTMNQVLQAIADLPDESKSARESKRDFRERLYEETKGLLDNIDTEGYLPGQIEALEAIRNIDTKQLSDEMMATLSVVVKNAYVNGSYMGAGPLVAEYKLQQRAGNKSIVDRIKSVVRIPTRWEFNARSERLRNQNISTSLNQIDSILKDRMKVGPFVELTGIQDYVEASQRWARRYNQEIRERVNTLKDRFSKDLEDAEQRMILGLLQKRVHEV